MLHLPSPRKWQEDAIKSWEINMSGIAKVVTGGGKTVFAGMCINKFISTGHERVVIIVPTTALRDQWYSIMCDSWKLSIEHIAIDRYQAVNNEWKYLILVVNTARELVSQVDTENTLLIVDECHRVASPVNRKALSGNWIATLGLSATPERQYDDYFRTVLIPNLGPIIVDYDYNQAYKDDVISPFILTNHLVEFTEVEAEKYRKFTISITREMSIVKSQGLVTSEKLERLLMMRASVSKNAERRLPVAVSLIQSVLPRKTILFHESISHIEAISMVLKDFGIDCRTYHSRLSEKKARESLSLFVNNSIDVLLTCRALDEGFDLPDIEVGIVASMTKSPRQRIQRLGRILRKVDGKIAEIKTIHTIHEEEMLRIEAARLDDTTSIRWFG
jgi:superfamily II DNA or RNA helicase